MEKNRKFNLKLLYRALYFGGVLFLLAGMVMSLASTPAQAAGLSGYFKRTATPKAKKIVKPRTNKKTAAAKLTQEALEKKQGTSIAGTDEPTASIPDTGLPTLPGWPTALEPGHPSSTPVLGINPTEEKENRTPTTADTLAPTVMETASGVPTVGAPESTEMPSLTPLPTQTRSVPVTGVAGSVHFTTGDTPVCMLGPSTLTASVKVTLTSGSSAILQTAWRIAEPADLRTDAVYTEHSVADGDTVSTSGSWPGVRAGDSVVEVHFGAMLLDPVSKNPVSSGAGIDFYWYPWYCTPPTVAVPPSATATMVPSVTASQTPTQPPTAVEATEVTLTPTFTETATLVPSETPTPPLPTIAVTVATSTPTETETATVTPSLTPTETTTVTSTPPPTLTNTPIPPTIVVPSATQTETATVTLTPLPPTIAVATATITATETATFTETPTATNTPRPPTATATAVPTSTSTFVVMTETSVPTVFVPTLVPTVVPTFIAASATSVPTVFAPSETPTQTPVPTQTSSSTPVVIVATATSPAPSNTPVVIVITATSQPSPTPTLPIIGATQNIPQTGGMATEVPQSGGGVPSGTIEAFPTAALGGSGLLPNKVPTVQAPAVQATQQIVPQTGEDLTVPTAPLAGLPLAQKFATYLGLMMLGAAFVVQGISRRR